LQILEPTGDAEMAHNLAQMAHQARCPLWVMSDTLGQFRSSDDVRYASDSDGIAAPPRSAASGQELTQAFDPR
jgi:hypothetical protein